MPSRTVPLPVLLPDGGDVLLRPRGAASGAHYGRPLRGRPGRGGRRDRPRLRAPRIGGVPQQRRGDRRGRLGGRCLPEDAHPGRSFVLREVLLHPRGPRFSRVRYPGGKDRNDDLLGPVVPGRGPADGARRGEHPLLPDRDRVAPPREGGDGERQRDAWRTVQRGHAIANGVYVAAANRVGHEVPKGGGAGIEFWGSSFLCDPQGAVLAEASADREEILLGEVDPARIEEVRRNWPFLRDRRIDAYAGITSRILDDEPWGKKR